MAKTIRSATAKREKFKKIENSKEKTSFNNSLRKGNYEDDDAFIAFKATKKR